MQDRSPPTRRNLLATHGRTIHWVKSGHSSASARCPLYPRPVSFATLAAIRRAYVNMVAALVMVGVGTWIGVGKGTSTSALAGSAVNPSAMMTSATDLRTAHYADYSVVFIELQTKR